MVPIPTDGCGHVLTGDVLREVVVASLSTPAARVAGVSRMVWRRHGDRQIVVPGCQVPQVKVEPPEHAHRSPVTGGGPGGEDGADRHAVHHHARAVVDLPQLQQGVGGTAVICGEYCGVGQGVRLRPRGGDVRDSREDADGAPSRGRRGDRQGQGLSHTSQRAIGDAPTHITALPWQREATDARTSKTGGDAASVPCFGLGQGSRVQTRQGARV